MGLLFSSNKSKKKIVSNSGVNAILFGSEIPDFSKRVKKQYSDDRDRILNEIKYCIINLEKLSKYQINFLENLDRKNLLDICKLYDKTIDFKVEKEN